MLDKLKGQNAKKNNTRKKVTDVCVLFILKALKFFSKNPDSGRKNASDQNVSKNGGEADEISRFTFGHIVGLTLTGFICGTVFGTVLALKIMQYLKQINAK